jgi:UDP-N-acetylglucosamine 2-epimerase (non-hydrolysing)
MKIVTVFGTRPEIIRLSQVIPRLDQFSEHILVHTGQNYDPNLSDIFFQELGVRTPDVHLGIQSTSFADQVGQIIARCGELLAQEKPDRLLILGDTNSGLSALVAARMRIPVFHMEAGNRCYDNRVPEEINRRIIDHSSDVLMPYTHRSKENLLREGIERQRIYVTGNPIFEVLNAYQPQIDSSDALDRLGVEPQRYFLVTLHRAENVDLPERLANLMAGLSQVGAKYQQPVVISVHPRTADKLQRFGIDTSSPYLKLVEPLGFFDFVALEKQANCILTDSGTVQEEASIFRIPNVTIRDVTERAETVEAGSNIITGAAPASVVGAVDLVLATGNDWSPPPEYLEKHVSMTVAKIVCGYMGG